MILALDIGNSQIHGGVFVGQEIKFQFRKNTKNSNSSDEFGLFLKAVLRENGIEPKEVREIVLCSVVPDVLHSIGSACIKYFDIHPVNLQPGSKTGLKIKYRNPLEVGADRIANAIAGTYLYPGQNLVLVDFGTATTYDVVTADKEYLGGMIMPGLRISMEALELRTAKLPAVEILTPGELVGRSTVESIQSGLYYGNAFALRGITEQIKKDYFKGQSTMVVGTGGFSRLFEKADLFDAIVPELVLIGLYRTLQLNKS
ncbi:MAG: type III pantothenate kinase [Oligoflexia bacterium]|nr:type III pantothenate kinase [Oligoflexia bacterium]